MPPRLHTQPTPGESSHTAVQARTVHVEQMKLTFVANLMRNAPSWMRRGAMMGVPA